MTLLYCRKGNHKLSADQQNSISGITQYKDFACCFKCLSYPDISKIYYDTIDDIDGIYDGVMITLIKNAARATAAASLPI